MEIYSTTLWHLRQESALSYLAHEVTAADRNAPESWCVVGNCFSLQKEHDAAVKFLERAVQLDPSFACVPPFLSNQRMLLSLAVTCIALALFNADAIRLWMTCSILAWQAKVLVCLWCLYNHTQNLRHHHTVSHSEIPCPTTDSTRPSYCVLRRYAHTLLGHEYISNEDFSKALECFRSAVHHDPRHYNAWYGLGTIYYRQVGILCAQMLCVCVCVCV